MKDRQHAVERWWEKHSPELDRIADRELLVLKIHIAVEDALCNLLAGRLGTDDDYISDLDLNFVRLVKLALPSKSDAPVREALIALNASRNKAAHSIQDPNFVKNCENFVRLISQAAPQNVDANEKDPVQFLRNAGTAAVFEVLYRAAPYWE